MDAEHGATVLLVGDGPDSEIGGWLERAGHQVRVCPGPSAPTYECVGSRTGRCPLAEDAHVVVLSLPLPGDVRMEGASASDLRSVYETAGLPVIVLEQGRLTAAAARWGRSEGLHPPVTENELLAAVDRARGRS